MVFTMDLEMEPSDHMVYEGVLSELPVGQLESGESREVDIAVCFLAFGRFGISAEVRGFNSSRIDSREAIDVIVAKPV